MNVVVLTVLQLKSIVMKEQINRTMEELWISSIVLSIKDKNYAFADWKSKIKDSRSLFECKIQKNDLGRYL